MLYVTAGSSQDAFFSQNEGPNLLLSPAHTHTPFTQEQPSAIHLSLRYRDQWSKIAHTAYSTAAAMLDMRIYSSSVDSWNIGLIMMNDKTASNQLNTNNVQLTTAYTRKLSGGHRRQSQVITLGGAIGFMSTNINNTDLWFGRQYDTNLFAINNNLESGEDSNFETQNTFTIDLGGRWIYINKSNQYGLIGALHHINRPSMGATEGSDIGARLTLQGIIKMALNSKVHQKATLTYVGQLSSFQIQPYYALHFKWQDHGGSTGSDDIEAHIGLGLRIANSIDAMILDAMIPTIGLSAERWQAAFSYDINTSDLNFYTNRTGAFELSLGYNMGSK